MAQLSDEIKAVFGKQLAVIATASKDGTPNVGPKGSMHVFDDETLVYSEGRCEKTLRNMQENPRVSVTVVDKEKASGYQVKGQAELLTSGELYENVAQRQESRNRPRPKYVVKITVEEIYSV